LKSKTSITLPILVTFVLIGFLSVNSEVLGDCTTNSCNVLFFDPPPSGGNDCGVNVTLCSTYQDTFTLFVFLGSGPSYLFFEGEMREDGFCADGCFKYVASIGGMDCSSSWFCYIRDSQGRNPCP
jgi:hypothetical protein